MFVDGLLYAVISRNLALGVGSMWKPILTPTLTPEMFSDHPPLVFWVESLFYRVFGDHLLVEGIYSCVTAVVTAALMVALWRRATHSSPGLARIAWLPVLFWAMTPQVTWSYSNNMLENTLAVFTTASCLVLLATFPNGRRIAGVLLAAVLVCAGLLSKGVVALFPVATLGILWLVGRQVSLKTAVSYTALLVALVAVTIGALLVFSDGARENITAYVDQQFLSSITGERGAVSNRFNIIFKVVSEVGPALGACVVLLAVNAFRRVADVRGLPSFDTALVCLLLGVAGSFPLVFSPRQSAFYLVPSFPMYATGLALLVAPIVRALADRIVARRAGHRAFAGVSAALLVAVLGYSASLYGTVRRNQPLIHDVKTIGSAVPPGSTVAVCDDLWRSWSLHGYFSRYHRINLDNSDTPRPFAVARGDDCPSLDMERYQRVAVATREFHLYRRR
jgi:4-amino-4-deoxy-L-arabinose transferase-like glycosyltransferase